MTPGFLPVWFQARIGFQARVVAWAPQQSLKLTRPFYKNFGLGFRVEKPSRTSWGSRLGCTGMQGVQGIKTGSII